MSSSKRVLSGAGVLNATLTCKGSKMDAVVFLMTFSIRFSINLLVIEDLEIKYQRD